MLFVHIWWATERVELDNSPNRQPRLFCIFYSKFSVLIIYIEYFFSSTQLLFLLFLFVSSIVTLFRTRIFVLLSINIFSNFVQDVSPVISFYSSSFVKKHWASIPCRQTFFQLSYARSIRLFFFLKYFTFCFCVIKVSLMYSKKRE